ncbi:MAG: 50S ribosomal protein L13 [Nanoarchaeota archaeon]|nr:50S ribosomal protein L13 [Nanoarchaeota archaeon]
MKIIDGQGAVMGRLASFAAKEALRGEEIVIVNCDKVIITGNKKDIKDHFERKKLRIGSGQKGPKVSRRSDMIVKRAIRGMLPNFRKGRGKILYGNIRCHSGVPKEFTDSKKIIGGKKIKSKFLPIEMISK